MTYRYIIATGALAALLSSCALQRDQEPVPEPTTQLVEMTTAEVSTSSEPRTEVQTSTVAETTTEASTAEETSTEAPTQAEPLIPDYEALGVNEMGHIMVVMYHGIKDNPPYHRTKDNFIKDMLSIRYGKLNDGVMTFF